MEFIEARYTQANVTSEAFQDIFAVSRHSFGSSSAVHTAAETWYRYRYRPQLRYGTVQLYCGVPAAPYIAPDRDELLIANVVLGSNILDKGIHPQYMM